MVYKFIIGSEESENFKLEIVIDAADTFMRLRNAILDAVGYSKDQMDSFFICDEDWNNEKEITYMDMGTLRLHDRPILLYATQRNHARQVTG